MRKPIKISIIGDFSVGFLGDCYARAFKQLGCDISIIPSKELWASYGGVLRNRFIHRLTINNFEIRMLVAQKYNELLQAKITDANPDIVLILTPEFISSRLLENISNKIKTAFFFADNPLSPHSSYRPEIIPIAQSVDKFFIWSRVIAQELKTLFNVNAHYLPFAWDMQNWPFSSIEETQQTDKVIFIGGWDKYREKILSLISDDFPLEIWGPTYWVTRCNSKKLQESWMKKSVFGKEAVTRLSSAKVAVNILRKQNLPDGTNMRTFELAGCGAFSLSTESSGAIEIFPLSSSHYYNESNLLEHLYHLFSANQKQRKDIISEAHLIACKNQYVHRATEVLKISM